MQDQGLEDEAKRHNVLFQMITTLAFKVMKNQMTKEGDEIDPRELHFLGKMMKDIMASSGIREKLVEEERRAAIARLDDAVEAGDIEAQAAQKAREAMGWA